MTTTYTVTGFELNSTLDSTNTYEFSIELPDNVTSVSYVIDFPDDEFFPEVILSPDTIEAKLDGQEALGFFPNNIDDPFVLIGGLNWSGGETVFLGLYYEGNTEADDIDLLFPIGGAELPNGAADDLQSFLPFLLNDLGITDPDQIPDGTFSAATGAFAPGQDILLSSIAWDSIVDNPNVFNGTSAADSITLDPLNVESWEIFGFGGNDTLRGGLGDDTILGGFGFDSIEGGGGNDSLEGNGNADTLIGGDGNDTLIDDAGTDSLVGGDGNDRIISGSGADRIDGGDGNDFIRAGSNFGSSVDGVNGGAGNDTIFGDAGFDLLLGGEGDDVIDGGAQADNVFGDAGNDTILGGDGFDRLFGGAGNDSIDGQQGTDALFGSFGDDTLNGGDDRDRFFGGADNDVLNGDGGDDELLGGGGFDTLNGGTGDDRLLGNFNADTFVFEDGHGDDTIADFDEFNGFEKIDLSAIAGISGLADLNLGSDTEGAAVQSGADVVITTSSGNTILVQNVDLADLDASDFIF
ncbi:MAG: hypothetical protein MK180_04565 [Rhodobacteraceae bacterium]|nr:hypothetical protein [Paracoccaceae bacterium]